MDFLHSIGHRDYLLLLLLSWAHKRGHASITKDFSVSCHVVSSVGLDTQSTTMKTNEESGLWGKRRGGKGGGREQVEQGVDTVVARTRIRTCNVSISV